MRFNNGQLKESTTFHVTLQLVQYQCAELVNMVLQRIDRMREQTLAQ
jgi:hypothetical protein